MKGILHFHPDGCARNLLESAKKFWDFLPTRSPRRGSDRGVEECWGLGNLCRVARLQGATRAGRAATGGCVSPQPPQRSLSSRQGKARAREGQQALLSAAWRGPSCKALEWSRGGGEGRLPRQGGVSDRERSAGWGAGGEPSRGALPSPRKHSTGAAFVKAV